MVGSAHSLLMSKEEAAAACKLERLRALGALKSQLVYCSTCASPLKYRSFTAHPCFKEAVARLGKWRARQVIKRLSTPPPPTSSRSVHEDSLASPPWVEERGESGGEGLESSVEVSAKPLQAKRKRAPSTWENERRVSARQGDSESPGNPPGNESAVLNDLEDFGARSDSLSTSCMTYSII